MGQTSLLPGGERTLAATDIHISLSIHPEVKANFNLASLEVMIDLNYRLVFNLK